MPPLIRIAVSGALALAILGAGDSAVAGCGDEIEVLSASVRYTTRLFQGKPTRRDAAVEVRLRSTSTTAVSGIELAVFLGVSLEAMEATRVASLPTSQSRAFDDGGLAFRAGVVDLLSPGATRLVTVERKALPLANDLHAVTVRVVDCRRWVQAGEATIAFPQGSRGADVSPWVWVVTALLVTGLLVSLFRALR